jgi:hypothetical protein
MKAGSSCAETAYSAPRTYATFARLRLAALVGRSICAASSRIGTQPAKRIDDLLPWAWAAARTETTAAAQSTARSIQPQTP